jgi:ATP-dependent helicase/nuclease subunit A
MTPARSELSDAQRRAVERTGQDVCVVAGPGSGKTRVLTERFAWLIQQRNVDPSRILAITFTEKAAAEIRRRLADRFAGDPSARESIERAWVSTIDGFCARLLREHAIDAGVAPDFAVLDQGAADRILRRAAEDALDELFRAKPAEMRRLLEALDLSTQDDGRQPDLAASLIEVQKKLRNSGLTEIPPARPGRTCFALARELAAEILRDPAAPKSPAQRQGVPAIREWASTFLALPEAPITEAHFRARALQINLGSLVGGSPARRAVGRLKNEVLPELESAWIGELYFDLHELLREAAARMDAAYQRAKRSEAALDFADLVAGAVRLLEHGGSPLRDQIASRFDHVLMDELQDTNRLQWRLVRLLGKPFFGVGDVNQSIYGFRGAEPAVFEEYRATLAARGAAIDELTENHRSRPEILEAVSRTFHGVAGVEPRELIAAESFAPGEAPVVERIAAQGDNAQDVEAAMVAGRIRALSGPGGYPLQKIAVLVRALSATGPFERAFDRFGIRFLVSGGRRFLEAREIRDLVMLLAALVNPLDEIALTGVLRGPVFGMSDEEIYRAGSEGRQEIFEERFGALRRMAGFFPPDLLMARALDSCNFTASLHERGRANVDKLLGWMRREHRRRPRPLAELLEDLESLRMMESEAEAPPPEAADAVRIMTIHQAKGLEFPVVFVSALHRRTETSRPVIAFSAELGLGAKWRQPATKRGESDTIHRALMDDLKIREEAEENRLLYVAMTRAKERLFLTYAEGARRSPWQKLVETAIGACTTASEAPLQALPALPDNRACAADTIVSPPLVTEQFDSAVTATDVAICGSCPRKYYLARYIGFEPESNRGSSGAMDFGLAVHKALAGEEVEMPEAATLARRFEASELGKRVARAVRVEREFDFAFDMDGVIVQGQIDLWFEEAGELTLVDYKTDHDDSSFEEYALQLRVYALALERFLGRLPDRALVCYLRSERAREVSLGADLASAKSAIRALRDAQESLEFPLHIGPHCLRCPFYGGPCPAAL